MVRALQSVPLRANDILARYGGEEFAVILADTDVEGALAVAERMRIAVRQLAFPHAKSPFDQTVSISIGAGVMEPRAQTAETMLIRIADQALYRSKLKGRNRITAVDEQHREREMEFCSPA